MYLDTDVVLSQIKPEDWLKDIVKRKLDEVNEKLRTSAITVVECQIVLLRDVSRSSALKVTEDVETMGIEILPITMEVLKQATKLLNKYPKLNIFDSIHLAHAILEGEKIMSTDRLFDEVKGVERIDPLWI